MGMRPPTGESSRGVRPTSGDSSSRLPPGLGSADRADGGRTSNVRTDGADERTLDPKMHPGYPDNLAHNTGPEAEKGTMRNYRA